MEVFILVTLIVLNAIFAMAEMAIGASSPAKLTAMADAGGEGARRALALRAAPSRLLASTQTGLTAVTMLTGVYGESLWAPKAELLIAERLPILAPFKYAIALGVVVVLITFAAIVFGEIVPKRLALARPEAVASALSGPMSVFGRASAPFIWALSRAADAVLSLFPKGEKEADGGAQIRAMIDLARKDGAIADTEGEILRNVFRLDNRAVLSIMTPAQDIDRVDLADSHESNLRKIRESSRSRLLVCKGGLGHIIGFIESRELLRLVIDGKSLGRDLDLASIPAKAPHYIPSTLTLIGLLEFFRAERTHVAIVVNEFGQTEGLVTISDLLGVVVGDVPSDAQETPLARQRHDGSWLLDGLLPIDEMKERLGLGALPDEELGNYHTVGGFVITQMGRIPQKADSFDWQGWRVEVVDMDRNRVDEVLATRLPPPPSQD